MNTEQKWNLIEASLSEQDFDTLVDQASQFLNCPIVIINNTSRIVSHSHSLEAPDSTWSNAVHRGYITLEFTATLNNWDQLKDKNAPYERMTALPTNTQRRRRFYKLTLHHQFLGYLNVTETDHNFDTQDEADFHFVAQLIAKELYLQYKQPSTGTETKNEEILLELIQGKFYDRGYFLDRVSLSSLSLNESYRALCIDLEHFSSYNADEDSFKNQLLSFFPKGVIAVDQQVLTVLIRDRHFSQSDDSTISRFDRYLKKKGLTCGISDQIRDLFDFTRYKSQAIKACKYCNYLLDHSHNYIFYDEVKIYDILKQIPENELIYYCNQSIYSLYQYDCANGTEYLDTLAVYLQSNHSVKATAGYLHLHRNTINYRIAKMRELFSLDLDDPNTANQLLLSCQMIQLIQQRESV